MSLSILLLKKINTFYIMSTTVKNIAKTTFSSFADSKWNDTVVFNSNSKVERQLEGYTEI